MMVSVIIYTSTTLYSIHHWYLSSKYPSTFYIVTIITKETNKKQKFDSLLLTRSPSSKL